MNQQELEALLKQIAPNNDPGRLEFSESTEMVDLPTDPNAITVDKQKKPVKVLTWVDRGTGQTLRVQVDPQTGTYTKQFQGVDQKAQGEPATTPAQQQAAAGASKKVPVPGHPGISSVTTSKQQSDGSMAEETHYENDAGQTVPQPATPNQIIPGTTAANSQSIGIWNQNTNEITWTDNPNAVPPKDQRWVFHRATDGTVTREQNPYYEKPSKIQKNEKTGKWEEITVDDNGDPIVKPVNDKTTIKPADLPVLQSKFGEISQGLGQLAQDLNSRVARGEITPEERTQAFTAAHQQAQTQVSEINTILENSKSIWSGQVQQRGQTLNETQSRRSFADSMANRAMQTGASVAAHSGKGSGAAIAGGVEALMRMGQRYAEGMGGFKESPEIGLPPALQQAQGISLPGYGPNAGAPPSPPPPPSGANVDATNAAVGAGSRAAFGGLGLPPVGAPAGASAAPAPPSGISNTTDAGGVPREYSPASSTVGSGLPPGVGGMGAALQGAQGYAGEPVAAGGAGVWNPTATVQGMLGDGSDPAWEEAVRRAAQAHGGMGR